MFPREHAFRTTRAALSYWLLPVLLVPALLSGCASSPSGAPPPETDLGPAFTERYQLGAGDTISISVWRNPELSVSVPVRPDGFVSAPLIGDVEVGGKTPEAVAEIMRERLTAFVQDPQVSVIVTGLASAEYLTRVRVTGAVQQPRSIPYRPGMTVMDLVLEAGGPTEFAAPSRTRLYRQGHDARDVDLDAVLRRGDLNTNFQLRPGDVITVAERTF
ncbi:MAG: polysaccharide biosynthesis/export family protein [Gammaproteobacteria bacterium]|nr:polysaccharide biosynthesis/export family protein [Gammaproteobacteria bacterium]